MKLAEFEFKFEQLYGSGNDKIRIVHTDSGHIAIEVDGVVFDNFRVVSSGDFIQFFTNALDHRIMLPLYDVRTQVALTIDSRVGKDRFNCSNRAQLAFVLDSLSWMPGPIFKICQAGVVPVQKDWKKTAKPQT